MTHPTNSDCSNGKKLETLMEKGFVIVAFAIFLFAMISTLTGSHHEAPANEGHGHGQSEVPAPAHH